MGDEFGPKLSLDPFSLTPRVNDGSGDSSRITYVSPGFESSLNRANVHLFDERNAIDFMQG
jgi:hypothetical protein